MNYNEIKEKACELSVMAQSQDVRILANLVRDLATHCESLEDDLSYKLDDPKYTETLEEVVTRHVETLPLGNHRIDEIASGIGMKSEIVRVDQTLRKLEGKIVGDRVMGARCEGRRRLFTISQHNVIGMARRCKAQI